jgi:hypothetical protein
LTEERHVHLIMGSGIGWLDIERDGWPDLYCCQGATFPVGNDAGPTSNPPTDTLYRNQSGDAFLDVTARTGIHNTSYSMGIAVADYDNDGFADLCVTGYEQISLYHNEGDGCFTRVPLPNDQQPGRFSASAAWSDIDADGDLDLYVANYAQLGPEDYPICERTEKGRSIHVTCHPSQFDPVHDLLYLNTGAGGFEEVGAAAGITQADPRPGLGVVAADLDEDGDVDFYVANDTYPNQLWENEGNGHFIDLGATSGTATNRHGSREAGMGIAPGDADGNGKLDLFVTNYFNETNTFYRNEGSLLFTDTTEELGLGAPSRSRLGFGTSFADFDSDGWQDLIVANGHVQDRLHELDRDEPFAQLLMLLHNQQGRRFREVTAGAGNYFRKPHVARSTAIADYDQDGDADVALNCLNDSVALLKNETLPQGNWVAFELIGINSNRSAVGAVLQLSFDGRTLVRSLHAGSGYLSSDESRILVGAADAEEVTAQIDWPGGARETWGPLRTNRSWRLIQGMGSEPIKEAIK